jgi:anti-anti-sigma regulatory factor
MALQIERKADFHIFNFSKELNIFSVKDDFESIKPLTQELISQLLIDISEVEDFDTAGLQLLAWVHSHIPVEGSIQWLGEDNPAITKLVELFSQGACSLSQLLAAMETA